VIEHVIHVFRTSPCHEYVVKTAATVIHAQGRIVSEVVLVGIEIAKLTKIGTSRSFASHNARSTRDGPIVVVFRIGGSLDVNEVNDCAKFMPFASDRE
jgi:hypothetical protein